MKNFAVKKTDQAYEKLKDRIFSGFYLPREHLVESRLCKDLNVNRMIVRDILKGLAIEGLVVMEPYKGCTVADISIQQVYETYLVEAVLEGYAGFLATKNMSNYDIKKLETLINESEKLDPQEVERWEKYNRQIHRSINRASRNTRLINMIKNNIKFNNYWFIALSTPGLIPKKSHQHKLILDSIKEKDANKVRQLIENHIMDAAKDIRERIQNIFPISD